MHACRRFFTACRRHAAALLHGHQCMHADASQLHVVAMQQIFSMDGHQYMQPCTSWVGMFTGIMGRRFTGTRRIAAGRMPVAEVWRHAWHLTNERAHTMKPW